MKTLITKIIALLTGYTPDKYLHFIAGLVISAFSSIVLDIDICILPTIAVGIAKELYDKITYGRFGTKDLIITILGGLIIQIFSLCQ